MFSGIIADIGVVSEVVDLGRDKEFTIKTSFALNKVKVGASIACDGACLTVTEKSVDSFKVTASSESLAKTILGSWQIGQEVNLEKALKLGDELDGHMVSGHIDDVAEIINIEKEGDCHKITLKVADKYKVFIVEKGSVTLNGISLTVNNVESNVFDVMIIPHTWQETTLQNLKIGHQVNFEVDLIARYLQKLQGN
jgi:riboflavin synthase